MVFMVFYSLFCYFQVLIEVVVDVVITLPYSIYNHLYSSAVIFSDPVDIAQNQLIIAVIRIFFYGNFSVSQWERNYDIW